LISREAAYRDSYTGMAFLLDGMAAIGKSMPRYYRKNGKTVSNTAASDP
jgi:hypothetical protein